MMMKRELLLELVSLEIDAFKMHPDWDIHKARVLLIKSTLEILGLDPTEEQAIWVNKKKNDDFRQVTMSLRCGGTADVIEMMKLSKGRKQIEYLDVILRRFLHSRISNILKGEEL